MDGPKASSNGSRLIGEKMRESADQIRVKRDTLKAVLEQCQRALELLKNTTEDDGLDPVEEGDDDSSLSALASASSPCGGSGSDVSELCDLLKSRVESPNFLEKLGSMQMSVSQNLPVEEGSSWDVVSETDWNEASDQDGYVLVRQEDIVEGMACFMAAYLLSLKETKELTPNQLQEALSKTFSIKKKKGKLRKAWDGSKVIYNVASWSATAVGIYQNPALLRAASAAFWTSCRVISKLL